MNILEEIHQYLTDAGVTRYDLHGEDCQFIVVTSPGPIDGGHPQVWNIALKTHQSLLVLTTNPSLSEAAQDMLDCLRERDKQT